MQAAEGPPDVAGAAAGAAPPAGPPPDAPAAPPADGAAGGAAGGPAGPPPFPPSRAVVRVAEALRALGSRAQVRALAGPAPTAATLAAALGVPPAAVVVAHVFAADSSPVLVLVAGVHRPDPLKLAGLLEVHEVRAAAPDAVRRHTAQEEGGVAPLGHPRPLFTLVDVELSRHPVVWAAAGDPLHVFPTTYEELLRITAGTAGEVGEVLAPHDRR